MTTVHVSVEVEAPPERVWEVVADPYNLGHWDRHIVSVEGLPSAGLAQGVRYVTVVRFMAVRAHVTAEVLEWDPPYRSVIALTGLLDATVTTTVEELPGNRSILEHFVDYHLRGGHLGELAARSLRLLGGPQLALRHGTLAQRRDIESQGSG